jgi:hypothetical protein
VERVRDHSDAADFGQRPMNCFRQLAGARLAHDRKGEQQNLNIARLFGMLSLPWIVRFFRYSITGWGEFLEMKRTWNNVTLWMCIAPEMLARSPARELSGGAIRRQTFSEKSKLMRHDHFSDCSGQRSVLHDR